MKKLEISTYNALIFFLIRGSFLGICSSNIYTIAKQNGWLSYIIATIIGLIPLIIYYYIIKNYPNKNIFQITIQIFGKIIGNIINVIIIFFVLIYGISIFYNLIVFISSQYLYRTPSLAIAIMFGICFLYMLNKGINTIARTSLMIFYITAFLYILTVIGLVGETNFSNFLPALENGLMPVINGSITIIGLNISPLFLLTVIPYNKIKENEKFIKNSIIFYIIAMISIFIVNFFVISIYGANLADIIQFPEFHLLKRLTLIGFAERIENILSLQLIFDLLFSIIISLYFVKEYVFLFIKRNTTLTYIVNTLLVTFFIIMGLNIFNSSTSANKFYLKFFNPLNIIGFIVIPLIIIISIKLKKKNYTNS